MKENDTEQESVKAEKVARSRKSVRGQERRRDCTEH